MNILQFKVELLNQNFEISYDRIKCLSMDDFGKACNILEEKGFMIKNVTKLNSIKIN